MDQDIGIIIVVALLAISEVLALIPGLKGNSVFQIIYFILKAITTGIRNKEV